MQLLGAPGPALRALPNINALWATLIVEELCRNGVSHFVICPGSRSEPGLYVPNSTDAGVPGDEFRMR